MDVFRLLAQTEPWNKEVLGVAAIRRNVSPYPSNSLPAASRIDRFFDHLTRLRGCHEIDSGEWSAEVYSFVADYALGPTPLKSLPEVTAVDRFIVPELVRGCAVRLVRLAKNDNAAATYRTYRVQDAEIADEALAAPHYGLRVGNPEEAKTKTCPQCAKRTAIVTCRQRWEWDLTGTQELELISLCPACLSSSTISYRYRDYGGISPQDWFSRGDD